MRQSNLQNILAVQDKQAGDRGLRPAYTIDGADVDEQLLDAIAAGHEPHIPLLIGSNAFPYAPDAQSMPAALLDRLLPLTARLYPDLSAGQRRMRLRESAPTGKCFPRPHGGSRRRHAAGHGAATLQISVRLRLSGG